MRLIRLAALAALVASPLAIPVALPAQSSMFGARGLGLPGRPLTPRTGATGGSFGLFDGESDLNPAAMGNLKSVAAGFVLVPTWRRWEGPEGNATLRDTRFPLISVGGPVPGTRLAIGIALGSYADRDFRLATRDSVTLRGGAVEVHDTLSSLGGLNQLRFAAAYQVAPKTTIGAAVYWITGSSRLTAHRSFADTSFLPVLQSSELSYQGVGVAVGITHELSSRIRLAALLRSDGKASVDRDSSHVYNIDLPYTVSAGAQLLASRRLTLAASAAYRTWSGANSDLVAQGSPGARNTLELAFGGEFARNLRRPAVLPLRLGFRYADLPFPLAVGQRPKELGLSAGTGLRFAQDRAGVDLALEQVWRSEGSAYKERAFSVVFGLSIRPYGLAR